MALWNSTLFDSLMVCTDFAAKFNIPNTTRPIHQGTDHRMHLQSGDKLVTTLCWLQIQTMSKPQTSQNLLAIAPPPFNFISPTHSLGLRERNGPRPVNEASQSGLAWAIVGDECTRLIQLAKMQITGLSQPLADATAIAAQRQQVWRWPSFNRQIAALRNFGLRPGLLYLVVRMRPACEVFVTISAFSTVLNDRLPCSPVSASHHRVVLTKLVKDQFDSTFSLVLACTLTCLACKVYLPYCLSVWCHSPCPLTRMFSRISSNPSPAARASTPPPLTSSQSVRPSKDLVWSRLVWPGLRCLRVCLRSVCRGRRWLLPQLSTGRLHTPLTT